jgi:hypothetical protein
MSTFDLDDLTSNDLEHLACIKREAECRVDDARIAGLLHIRSLTETSVTRSSQRHYMAATPSAWECENQRLVEQSDPARMAAVAGFEPRERIGEAHTAVRVEPYQITDDFPLERRIPLTLGYYRKRSNPHPPAGCPIPIPTVRSIRPWQPWELVVAAINMASEAVPEDVAGDVLAQLATFHGLNDDDIAQAVFAYRNER